MQVTGSIIGFPTCHLNVAHHVSRSYPIPAGPFFDVPLNVPSNNDLIGSTFYFQAIGLGSGGGLQLTGGFGLTIY